MTTIGERVKAVRKANGLNQEEFGKRIGLKKNSVSQIESGKNTVTDQNCLLICREFGVNENWLRTGNGEMFNKSETFSLDEFVRQHGGTKLELEILKAYFELPENMRKVAMDYIKSLFAKRTANPPAEAPAPLKPVKEMTREDLHAELDRQLDLEERAAEGSGAS